MARTVAVITVAWAVLVGAYALLPVRGVGGAGTAVRLAGALLLFAGVVAWQARGIARADFPQLRAARALGVAIPLFLVLFSIVYLSLGNASPGEFSQHLDHTRALYFTVTVFATVGFGDITPRSDPARALVTVQMVLDLLVIGVLARLLFAAAREGLASGGRTSDPPPGG